MELFDYKQVKERWPGFNMGIFGHSPDTVSRVIVPVARIERATRKMGEADDQGERMGFLACQVEREEEGCDDVWV